jgi:ABC-type oligopeptide transport system substrate-binding subunit
MSLALEQVGQARNWRQARDRLRDVHQVAYYDLPVIPLWQTVDSYAYHKSLQGIGTKLVTLYQNVADWRVTYDRGAR